MRSNSLSTCEKLNLLFVDKSYMKRNTIRVNCNGCSDIQLTVFDKMRCNNKKKVLTAIPISTIYATTLEQENFQIWSKTTSTLHENINLQKQSCTESNFFTKNTLFSIPPLFKEEDLCWPTMIKEHNLTPNNQDKH